MSSFISCGSFVLSCAKYIQNAQTKSVLESIDEKFELLRDRKLRSALCIMNDLANCTNHRNVDFYAKSAYVLFVEAIHSYNIEEEYRKFSEISGNDRFRDFSSVYFSSVPGYSLIDKTWSNINKKAISFPEKALNYHRTACIGAGICSFYLKDYNNSFSYFDKALYVDVKNYNDLEALSRFNFFNRSMRNNLLNVICYSSGEIFLCINELKRYINIEHLLDYSNLKKLYKVYTHFNDILSKHLDESKF